jgi:hypothetical protein
MSEASTFIFAMTLLVSLALALWALAMLALARAIRTTPPLRGLLSEIKEANRNR